MKQQIHRVIVTVAREAVVNSIAPAEWSFQTYIRPFRTAGAVMAACR